MPILFEKGQVVEVRILNASHVLSGYYDDFTQMAADALAYSGKGAVYVTLNPVNPALLARAHNRLKAKPKSTTTDADILCRRWLPIDFDPRRPSGISSTDTEHNAALERAQQCMAVLREMGWPDPVYADSGNGAHLLFRIDLPNDPQALKTIEGVYKALAVYFSDEEVDLDQTTKNAARIWKVYGTMSIKGDDTPDRPHRKAAILYAPPEPEVVPAELLLALADTAPVDERPASSVSTGGTRSDFDLDAWIETSGLPVAGPMAWNGGGRKWILNPCPWNADHTNKAAFIIQFPSGAIAAGCRHNGCIDNHWPELRKLVDPSWKPYEEREGSLQQIGTDKTAKSPFVSCVSDQGEHSSNVEWPEPQALPDSLPPVEPFDSELLPEAFRPWVEDVAERMQCPPDYLAVGAMVAAGAVVGRQVGIHPKREDDWLVVSNLWGMAIGRPSLMKTPALQEILRPLDRLESGARESYEQTLRQFEADQMVAEAKKKNAQDELRKAIKHDRDPQEIALACVGAAPEPACQRYVVNDSTVEKLGEILSANPRGVLLSRDELTGFLRNLDRQGHEADRAFYLEAWSGTGSFTYDRIGRGTVRIDAACVSILGGIQPGPLSAYVRGAAQGKGGDDGLMQRFQLAVYPDVSPTWENHDRKPDLSAQNRAWAVFGRLDILDPASMGAALPDHQYGGIPSLRFGPEAQEIFTEWRTELELRLRQGEDPPIIEAHLGKYRSLPPSLALLIHLADEGSGPVGTLALKRALAWTEYLETHARRSYSPALSPAAPVARALAKRIQRGDLKGSFTLRDAYRNQWSGLTDGDEVLLGIDLLEALGWVRGREERTAGRPTVSYQINPRVLDKEANRG